MPINFVKVKPGDLVTSKLVNDMIDAIAELQKCCEEAGAGGEGGGTPVPTIQIDRFDPARVGLNTRTLSIIGSGFQGPTEPLPIVTALVNLAARGPILDPGKKSHYSFRLTVASCSDGRIDIDLRVLSSGLPKVIPAENRPESVSVAITVSQGARSDSSDITVLLGKV
jgi:hypothetical protein